MGFANVGGSPWGSGEGERHRPRAAPHQVQGVQPPRSPPSPPRHPWQLCLQQRANCTSDFAVPKIAAGCAGLTSL